MWMQGAIVFTWQLFFLKAYFEVAELMEVKCLAAVFRHSSINLSFSSGELTLG